MVIEVFMTMFLTLAKMTPSNPPSNRKVKCERFGLPSHETVVNELDMVYGNKKSENVSPQHVEVGKGVTISSENFHEMQSNIPSCSAEITGVKCRPPCKWCYGGETISPSDNQGEEWERLLEEELRFLSQDGYASGWVEMKKNAIKEIISSTVIPEVRREIAGEAFKLMEDDLSNRAKQPNGVPVAFADGITTAQNIILSLSLLNKDIKEK